jgi:hypothetical protein
MPKIVRIVAFVLAVVAGVLLLISGIHGPSETYQLIIDNLPLFIQDQQILQIANMVALILITISLAGGIAVIAGGIPILANRRGIGRWLIGLGAGIGIPWLIMLAITLMTTGQVASVLAEYSSTGWVGLILAFIAGAIAK